MPRQPPEPTDFERSAHQLLGQLLMLYSRLDVNLALFVARYRGPEHVPAVQSALEGASFKTKLDLVLPAVVREYGERHECLPQWRKWHSQADKLRNKRNELVHGRWGIYERHGLVSNIIGLPWSPDQREIKYTLAQLAAEVAQATAVSLRFAELSSQWPA